MAASQSQLRRSPVASCSQSGLLDGEADRLGDARSVLRVDLVEVREDALLDVAAALAETTRDVLDDLSAHLVVKDLAEKDARLLVVGVRVLVLVAAGLAIELLGSPGVDLVLDGGAADRVRLIVGSRSIATVDGHETITGVVVAHASTVGAVDRDLIVVGAETVSVSIRVVDETALKHLVVGWLNTWDHVGGGEGRLFSLSVEVLRVLVKNELANLDERVVGMRPDLSHVIDIEAVVIGISDRHDLSKPSP